MRRSPRPVAVAVRVAPWLAVVALFAAPSEAALQKYRLETVDIHATEDFTPTPVVRTGNTRTGFLEPDAGPPQPPFDSAIIESGGPAGPVLRRFRIDSSFTGTFHGYPAVIFVSDHVIEGPGPLRKPASFTGTGSTAAGSSIRWGIVTGWTITGSHFTRCLIGGIGGPSPFPPLCEWIGREHDTTVDPVLHSEFYDLGTWFFHATGFTATPFPYEYFVDSEGADRGNRQRWVRGFPVADATVPALPLLGSLLLTTSLVLGGLAAVRRHRRRG